MTRKSITINYKHIRKPYLTLQDKYRNKRKLKKLITRWSIASKITLIIVIAMFGWWLINRPTPIAGAIEEQHSAIKLEKLEHREIIIEKVINDTPQKKTLAKEVKKQVSKKSLLPQSDIQRQVQDIANEYGWGTGEQWEALSWIIQKESGWRVDAQNPTSTAFGLFQHLDGTRKSYNCPKTTDIRIQTECGIRYIQARYKTPTGARQFWNQNKWY